MNASKKAKSLISKAAKAYANYDDYKTHTGRSADTKYYKAEYDKARTKLGDYIAELEAPRYALFLGAEWDASGGVGDFKQFGTIDELRGVYEGSVQPGVPLWGQIVNTRTMEVIEKL